MNTATITNGKKYLEIGRYIDIRWFVSKLKIMAFMDIECLVREK